MQWLPKQLRCVLLCWPGWSSWILVTSLFPLWLHLTWLAIGVTLQELYLFLKKLGIQEPQSFVCQVVVQYLFAFDQLHNQSWRQCSNLLPTQGFLSPSNSPECSVRALNPQLKWLLPGPLQGHSEQLLRVGVTANICLSAPKSRLQGWLFAVR